MGGEARKTQEMLHELLILAAIGLFALVEGWRMGLHQEVPPDPNRRMAYFANCALQIVKAELYGAALLGVEGQQVRFVSQRGTCRLWCESGMLWTCVEGEEAVARQTLGPLGSLSFRYRGEALHCEIVAGEPPRFSHTTRACLAPVKFQALLSSAPV